MRHVICSECQLHYMHKSSSLCSSITFASQAEVCIMFSIMFLSMLAGQKSKNARRRKRKLKEFIKKFWILKPWTCFICHLFILYIYSIYILNPLAALCHVIFLNVIFKDVWLRRKYEAIYPEFNGAGMPLTHFIVHYMKGQGHRVDICCAPSGKEPLL